MFSDFTSIIRYFMAEIICNPIYNNMLYTLSAVSLYPCGIPASLQIIETYMMVGVEYFG